MMTVQVRSIGYVRWRLVLFYADGREQDQFYSEIGGTERIGCERPRLEAPNIFFVRKCVSGSFQLLNFCESSLNKKLKCMQIKCMFLRTYN